MHAQINKHQLEYHQLAPSINNKSYLLTSIRPDGSCPPLLSTPGPGSYTAGSTLLKAQQHRQHTTADTNTADGSASRYSHVHITHAKYTFLALHSTGALPTCRKPVPPSIPFPGKLVGYEEDERI